jgi:autotransporter-associated beta strand protein
VTTLNGGDIALASTALTVSAGTHAGVISGSNGTLTKATAGTLILSGANTFGGAITISAGKLQIGAGLTTGSIGAGAIANAGILEINRSDALSFANVISGAGSLVKNGAGALTLTGNNTFEGGVSIPANGGNVIAGHSNALGTGTVTLNSNTQLVLADGITISNAVIANEQGNFKGIRIVSGTAAITGNISVLETSAGNFDINAETGSTLTLSGIISGNAIETNSAGTVILSGANTFTGGTLVSAGTLSTTAGALAGTTGITVGASGTLSAVDFNSVATLTLSGTASAATITGATLSVGAVTNAGTATNALNFTASTGTITLASLSGAGNSTFGSAATITGGVSTGVINVTGLLTAAVSGGTVNAGSMTGDVGSSVTVTGLLTGEITAGTNSLGSLSSASVTGGTNTITGAATVALVNGGTTTVGGVANITTLTTGTINLNGATSSIGTLTDGTVNLGTTALTVNAGTFVGLLAGTNGSLIKASAGTLTLSGANTFGGGTTVNNGILFLGNAGSLGAGAVTVASGATLDLNSLIVSNVITVQTGGTITGGQTTASVTTTGSPPAVTAVLTGAGGLTKTDAGTLTISTANFHTGATVANVAGAVIRAAHLSDTSSSLGASALTDVTKLQLGSGAVLEFTGATTTSTRSFTLTDSAGITTAAGAGGLTFTTAAKIALSGTTPALALVANNSGTNIFRAALSQADIDAGRGLSVLTIDGAGTWVIGGHSNRFKGDIRIDAFAGATLGFESGSLGMGSGYSTSVIQISHNAVLVWSGANTDDISSRIQIPTGATAKMNLGANDVTFAAAPKDANGAAITNGKIEKSGAGTLKIASTVTSPGLNFDVPTGAGKLTINGTVGNVTLAAGTTLGGEGFVGAVTAASGSTIGPGNSPGTLTASTFAMFGGSTFEWQVQDANTGAGTGYDTLTVTGALDLSGASSNNRIFLNISSLAGNGNGTDLGNPLNFGPPAGVSSIRTFTFATVGSLNLGSNVNINDVFTILVDDFNYTGGNTSNAGLWSLSFADNAITLTAVPEPSTYGFGLGALALAAAAIRRRRKRQATKA